MTVGGVGEGRVCSDVDNAHSLALSLSLSDILTKSLSTPLICYLVLQMHKNQHLLNLQALTTQVPVLTGMQHVKNRKS